MLTHDEAACLLLLVDELKADMDNGGPISLIDLRVAIEGMTEQEERGCRGGCGAVATTDDGYCRDCD